jgi:hypothetical protein
MLRIDKTIWLAVVALAACLCINPYAESVKLQNRFVPGERAEMKLVADVTGTFAGQPIEYSFQLTMELLTLRVQPADRGELQVSIRSLSIKGKAQGQVIDHSLDQATIASKAIKTPLIIKVSPSGAIESVTGGDELKKLLPAWLDFRKYFVEGELLFPSLPQRAIEVGSSWSVTGGAGIPFVRGQIPASIQRTLKEVRTIKGAKCAILNSQSRVKTNTVPVPDEDVISGIKFNTFSQDVETEMVFDIKAGHILESNHDGQFEATMTPIQPEGLNLPSKETAARMWIKIHTETKYSK